jgi:hypothetical protein
MVRTHSWLVAALAIGLAGGACKKDDAAKPADKTADTTKPADKTTDKPADPGMAKPADKMVASTPSVNANASDLALLPLDSEVVMGLNWAQLQKSELFTKFVAPKLKESIGTKLDSFKEACGFDPFDAVQSVSAGIKGVGDTTGATPTGAFVVHGFDKSKVMACVDKAKEAAKKDGSELTQDGDVLLVKDKKGESVAFMFTNDSTLLAVIGPQATKAGVTEAAQGKSTLATSPAFTEMYSKINSGDSMWMLMNGNSKAFEKMPIPGAKIKAMMGSVNVTDGLTLDARIRLDSPDKAAELANMGKMQAAQAAKMFDKLDISADAADVHVQIGLSQTKLGDLIKQFGGMLGGMGGGGMGATP